jgi:hypothetical protein
VNGKTHITFIHSYENLVSLGDRVAAYFCNKLALKLYRQALPLARNEQEREYCRKNITALEAAFNQEAV